jgi:Domain of unknown function (DUF2017)
MGRFRREESAIVVSFDADEVALLEHLISEVAELVQQPMPSVPGAEWARELGLEGLGEPESSARPTDPVTARLFPDAYRDDDAAAGDFRRFTDGELRAGKAANAKKMLDSLPADGGLITLDEAGSAAWLGAVNDARLALGTALKVDENTDYEMAMLAFDDPRVFRLEIYHWLGMLQASLLGALTGEAY